MGSGGSRSRSGPPPDPSALRRDREADWRSLPASGREGEAPEWPLLSPSSRELDLWRAHWTSPQAVVWEENDLRYEVALYVRNLAMAEVPGSPANRSTLVRQLMDDLGLTESGLARNRWRVVEEPTPETRKRRRRVARPAGARERLQVVMGGRSDQPSTTTEEDQHE